MGEQTTTQMEDACEYTPTDPADGHGGRTGGVVVVGRGAESRVTQAIPAAPAQLTNHETQPPRIAHEKQHRSHVHRQEQRHHSRELSLASSSSSSLTLPRQQKYHHHQQQQQQEPQQHQQQQCRRRAFAAHTEVKPQPKPPPRVSTAVWISILAAVTSWYCWGVYGIAAEMLPALPGRLYLSTQISPHGGPHLVLILRSIGRLLGATLLGHIGDRVGRHKALATSLLIIGVSTIGLAVAPIGPGARLKNVHWGLRFCQGVGIGGQWAGCLLLPFEACEDMIGGQGERHQYILTSLSQAAIWAGMALATVAAAFAVRFNQSTGVSAQGIEPRWGAWNVALALGGGAALLLAVCVAHHADGPSVLQIVSKALRRTQRPSDTTHTAVCDRHTRVCGGGVHTGVCACGGKMEGGGGDGGGGVCHGGIRQSNGEEKQQSAASAVSHSLSSPPPRLRPPPPLPLLHTHTPPTPHHLRKHSTSSSVSSSIESSVCCPLAEAVWLQGRAIVASSLMLSIDSFATCLLFLGWGPRLHAHPHAHPDPHTVAHTLHYLAAAFAIVCASTVASGFLNGRLIPQRTMYCGAALYVGAASCVWLYLVGRAVTVTQLLIGFVLPFAPAFALLQAAIPAIVAELFRRPMRYTGAGVVYHGSHLLFEASFPWLAHALIFPTPPKGPYGSLHIELQGCNAVGIALATVVVSIVSALCGLYVLRYHLSPLPSQQLQVSSYVGSFIAFQARSLSHTPTDDISDYPDPYHHHRTTHRHTRHTHTHPPPSPPTHTHAHTHTRQYSQTSAASTSSSLSVQRSV